MIEQNFVMGNIFDGAGAPLTTATVAATPAFMIVTPGIVLTLDYLLRDEANAAITDEYGDSISLEGLLYA